MHITRLRLLGFKSFVEPAELVIERGLTGVVGPNGCGKSNLLEALRWVMGETSYKSMRASSMEDVIFSGTHNRPARNIAEVAMVLDNRERRAHSAFNDEDNLEIKRRIERDKGSDYTINTKPVRARDVQLLFADASTGAHSPALVQQGRIGEIVSAKPANRRFVLEEAAGISGLHSRRHEAEIKLRGAENNLERLLDIMGEMQSRLDSLKRQARQVKRYRALQRELENLQVRLHYNDWLSFAAKAEDADKKHAEILQLVGETTSAEAQFRRLQAQAADALPPLREREMVTAAIVQRLTIELEQCERAQQARLKQREELTARLAHYSDDFERAKTGLGQDELRITALEKELSELQQQAGAEKGDTKQAQAETIESERRLREADSAAHSLNNQLAAQRAERTALEREITDKQQAIETLALKTRQVQEEQRQTQQQLDEIADYEALQKTVEERHRAVQKLEERQLEAELNLEQTRTDENEALQKLMQLRGDKQVQDAQITTLENLLLSSNDEQTKSVVNEIKVTPGYETALGAALGDELDASLDERAKMVWRQLPEQTDLTPLPPGAIPLSQLVRAPKPLALRLTMTGVIEPGEGGDAQKQLVPGQRLVSVEGDLWRWDGFIARADAPTNAARRLAEKNRLDSLRLKQQTAIKAEQKARQSHETVKTALEQAQNRNRELKEQLRTARSAFETAKAEQTRAEQEATRHRARLDALLESARDLGEQKQGQQKRLSGLHGQLATQADLSLLEKRATRERAQIETLQADYHAKKVHLGSLEHTHKARTRRIEQVRAEIKSCAGQIRRAQEQLDALQTRRARDETALAALGNPGKDDSGQQDALASKLEQALLERQNAGDKLAEADNTLREIEKSLQAAQSEAAGAREERARLDAQRDAARQRLEEHRALIRQELDCTPEDCPAKAGLGEGEILPARDELERRIKKASDDRARLGGVNLMAEEEAIEVSNKITEMQTEHDDLSEAIKTLRQAISGLNREGRKRLMNAFEEINAHFERLFTTLFGGGKARLELIESDDPLQAGLEIIASPPGKKPQVLTLLSGGEKALTALSLIFAVFLTNPAPICVLDEVDAPLDDANVERFCSLLDEMTRETATRFLVITHHPTTMARMDRLFGVTMAEKGISQLVSVDLSTAESYIKPAQSA